MYGKRYHTLEIVVQVQCSSVSLAIPRGALKNRLDKGEIDGVKHLLRLPSRPIATNDVTFEKHGTLCAAQAHLRPTASSKIFIRCMVSGSKCLR